MFNPFSFIGHRLFVHCLSASLSICLSLLSIVWLLWSVCPCFYAFSWFAHCKFTRISGTARANRPLKIIDKERNVDRQKDKKTNRKANSKGDIRDMTEKTNRLKREEGQETGKK